MAVKTAPSKSRASSSSSSASTKTKFSSAILASKQGVKPKAAQLPAKASKKKGNNKFRDARSREALDLQTSHLLHGTTEADSSSSHAANYSNAVRSGQSDPFSYGSGTEHQRRETRKQVEATADALNALCGLMN